MASLIQRLKDRATYLRAQLAMHEAMVKELRSIEALLLVSDTER